ncbi:MAG: Uma2 family endonuclease, partial [Dehalococcoidia bacterium]
RLVLSGEQHGRTAGSVYCAIVPFVRERSLGIVRFDTCFVLRRTPDRVVNPDVGFMATGRLDPHRDQTRAIPAAPTLAVEVVSPNDRDQDVGAKVLEYLAAGSERVWVVRPESRTVTVYRADGTARIHHESAVLDSDDAGFAVDGFALRVASLFA